MEINIPSGERTGYEAERTMLFLRRMLRHASQARKGIFRLNSPSAYLSLRESCTIPWTENHFKSIKVDLSEATKKGWRLDRVQDFAEFFDSHLGHWRKEGRGGVWLHLPIPLAFLVPEAASIGFQLHHAKGEEIVMSLWLQPDQASRLPPYASHQVGACGVVCWEDTEQVLVTQDRHKLPFWKFPGGLSEFAEDIADTAVREVLEETGIKSEFQSLLVFRQQHHMPHSFDFSDLYFVCRLKPLSYDITPCKHEILRCEWRGLRELASAPDATPMTQLVSKLVLRGLKEGFEHMDIAVRDWGTPALYGKIFHRKGVV
eukprot:Em0022g64a